MRLASRLAPHRLRLRQPIALGGQPRHYSSTVGDSSKSDSSGSDDAPQPSAEEAGMERADRITKVGAVANMGMAALKGVVGTAACSPALQADAVHSLSDLVSDGVSLWALHRARRPPDKYYPYGHGKFEAVGSACVGGLLVAAGGGIGIHAIHAAVDACSAVEVSQATLGLQLGAAAVAALSVGIKEALYRQTLTVATEVRSSTLAANAWHHRSDALSSVVALVGIGGAACGVPLLDPLAGVLVSALILKEGASIGSQALRELTDSQVEPELLAAVIGAARRVPEVLWLAEVRGRALGPYLLVDMRVSIDPAMSASVAQQVATKVRREVATAVPQVTEVLVHFDTTRLAPTSMGSWGREQLDLVDAAAANPNPLQPLVLHEAGSAPNCSSSAATGCSPPYVAEVSEAVMRPMAEIEAEIRGALSSLPEVWGCSHVRLLWDAARGGAVVQADLLMDPSMRVRQAMRVGGAAKRKLEELPDVLEADLHLELLLPCTVLDARELVPSNSALPRPDTPAASAAAVGAAARAERAAMVTARASFLARAAATQASDEAKDDSGAEYRGDSK